MALSSSPLLPASLLSPSFKQDTDRLSIACLQPLLSSHDFKQATTTAGAGPDLRHFMTTTTTRVFGISHTGARALSKELELAKRNSFGRAKDEQDNLHHHRYHQAKKCSKNHLPFNLLIPFVYTPLFRLDKWLVFCIYWGPGMTNRPVYSCFFFLEML